jgi:hypothetical protein
LETYSVHGTPISEGAYTDGKPTGPWTYYDDAGVKMREQELLDGDPHGKCTVYDQRGRVVQEMYYRNGRLHGTMTFYDRNGRPTKTTEYEDGKVKRTPPAAVLKASRLQPRCRPATLTAAGQQQLVHERHAFGRSRKGSPDTLRRATCALSEKHS